MFSCLIISSNGLFTSENVIFQKANEIFTNDAHWYVTFVHDLKPYQGLINKISHDINSTNEIVQAVKDIYRKRNFYVYAETFKSLQIEADLLTDIYQSIYRTFENYKILHNGKHKRSLLPFVGQLMSSLFGTVSENDLENINRNIDILADNQEKIVHDLKMSLSILNMTRVQVSENRRSIMDLIICVQKLDDKILELQHSVEEHFTRLEQFVHTYLQFKMIFDEIKLAVQNAIFYLENLKSELNILSLNHISINTISPVDLKVLLLDIESKLPNNYKFPENPRIDIWYFYKTLTCMTYLENDQIRIVLKIPLIDTRETYEIFRAHNIPFPFHNTSVTNTPVQLLAQHQLESEILMVSKNRESYALLAENDYNMCTGLKSKFCNPKTVFYPTNMNKFCVMALFMKNEDDIKGFCKQTVILNVNLPFAKYLSDGIWIVVTNKVLHITISCRSTAIQSTDVDIKPPFGILHINNTCKASSKYMRLPGQFDKTSYFERSDSLKSLLKLHNVTHFIIGQKFSNKFNLSEVEIPPRLLNLKEIPSQTFMHEIQHLRKVNTHKASFWTFANVTIVVLVLVIVVTIVWFKFKSKCQSSHSFCLRGTVNEHETGITVLKLPTNDVVESKTTGEEKRKSVTLDSGSVSATFKDQNFLGQTDASMAWPRIGTKIV